MRIKEIVFQYRRDFSAIYECDHCGFQENKLGYDDTFFHEKVVPEMICPKCGKKAKKNYRPLATKYQDEFQV